jgi:hypothetical protein
MWLVSHNKLLTRDNLSKDKMLMTCPVCSAMKWRNVNIPYVASDAWAELRITCLNIDIGQFVDVAELWNNNSKFLKRLMQTCKGQCGL